MSDETFTPNTEATSLPCPNCGAAITYNPTESMFCCEYCGGRFSYQQMETFRDREREREEADKAYGEQLDEYGCPSCGASIIADHNTVAQFCAYCGNPVILKGRVTGQQRPQKIIPFAIGKEKAVELLRAYLGKKWYVPNNFRSQSTLDTITGVYHPFWMTDADTDCSIDARGTKVTVWVVGNKRYTKTDTYAVWRRADIHFEDIATNALSDADKQLVEGVLPFPCEAHRDFDMTYLSGFYAKRNDLTRDDVKAEVSRRMHDYAKQLLSQTVRGYDTLKVEKNAVIVNNSNWDYTMLPIWLLHYRYHNRTYTFAVNGYTGKLFGTLPVSRPKLGITFGVIAAAAGAVLALLGGLIL